MKPRILIFPLLIAVALSGCAAQKSFRQGNELLRQGKVEEGLNKLKSAERKAPDNVEYKTTLYREQERQIQRLLAEAETLRTRGELDKAEGLYRRVLKLDPDNPRAPQGLAAIANQQRAQALVKAAQEEEKRGDGEAARKKLRQALALDAGNDAARRALRTLEEKQGSLGISEPQLSSVFDRPVTLEFRDAPLKSVLDVLARYGQLNFVLDKDVRPDTKVTVFARNLPIREALDMILVTGGLAKKVLTPTTLLLYPNIISKQREYQDQVVKAFYLGDADGKATLNLLRSLLKLNDIYLDERLNMIYLRGTPEQARLAEKVLALQDQPAPEVVLDVEVLEVNRSRLTDLGLQPPTQFTVLTPVPSTTSSTTGGVIVTTTSGATQLTLDNLRHLTGAQIGINNPVLNLLKQDGDVNLLANPRIRVVNKEKAKILIGDKVPVITTTATANVGVSESVNYLDVGLKLEVQPEVYPDNDVGMNVNLEVSNITQQIKGSNGSLVYQISTRSASTTLRLKDGETQALAGLIQDSENDSATGLPFLSDIPIVGRLFADKSHKRVKDEIVLLITPHIVRNLEPAPLAATEFPAGTEGGGGATFLRPGPPENPVHPLPVEPSPVAEGEGAPGSAPAPGVPRPVLPGRIKPPPTLSPTP